MAVMIMNLLHIKLCLLKALLYVSGLVGEKIRRRRRIFYTHGKAINVKYEIVTLVEARAVWVMPLISRIKDLSCPSPSPSQPSGSTGLHNVYDLRIFFLFHSNYHLKKAMKPAKYVPIMRPNVPIKVAQ